MRNKKQIRTLLVRPMLVKKSFSKATEIDSFKKESTKITNRITQRITRVAIALKVLRIAVSWEKISILTDILIYSANAYLLRQFLFPLLHKKLLKFQFPTKILVTWK